MANETRMNKYKEFRDSFKDDEQPIRQVVDDSVGEDDFLSFLPHNNEKDDLHPLSYDTLEEDDIVLSAINEAKINVGKDKYNTRAEILNKIRSEESQSKEDIQDLSDEPTKIFHLDELQQEEKKEVSDDQEIDYSETSLDQDNAVVRPFSLGDPSEKQEPQEEAKLTKKELKALKKAEKKKAQELKKQEEKAQKAKKKEEKTQKEMPENEKKEPNRFVSGLLNVIIFVLILIFLAICWLYIQQFLI